MVKTIALLTAEDVYRLGSDCRGELIDGVLIEMPPVNVPHGRVTMRLGSRVLAHADANDLGHVYTEVGFILRRNPDRLRAPDIAFVRKDRIPPEGKPSQGFWEFVPDLVVEVISPGDAPGEVQLKIREWIEAGVRLLWAVYPDTWTITVMRSLLDRRN